VGNHEASSADTALDFVSLRARLDAGGSFLVWAQAGLFGFFFGRVRGGFLLIAG